MRCEPGVRVLLTGATGGLGTHLTTALARRGTRLGLVAYPGQDLEVVADAARRGGAEAHALVSDLSQTSAIHKTVEYFDRILGAVDILVNNAGVEYTRAYHELTEDQIIEVLRVNLEAPMLLSRLLLPGMIKRRSGHIVNISSLAGKAPPAFQEPYAASKAGLVAFTASLRETYRGTGISASVICPGFIETGIYERLKTQSGLSAPRLLGTSTPDQVARATLAAIDGDLPELIINPTPVRPLLAFTQLFPRWGAALTRATGGSNFFRRAAARLKQQGSPTAKTPNSE